jgi:murein DD-endopeptidase MepM/ murein hydrolase activator NlpD
MIRIQHANGYETMYMHLSRRFVGTGDRVEQGDRIGLVGSTGLATGPHLDFRMRRNGSYVNFERLQLPRDSEVGKEKMGRFASLRDGFRAMMESGQATLAAAIIAREGSPAALCKVP